MIVVAIVHGASTQLDSIQQHNLVKKTKKHRNCVKMNKH